MSNSPRRQDLNRDSAGNRLAHSGAGSAERRDLAACQLARIAVESAIVRNLSGHLRFEEIWSVAETLVDELPCNRSIRIAANPIRVWTRFESPLFLGDEVAAPAEVLFFPNRRKIHSAVLSVDAAARLRELAGFGPCTLDEWLMTLESFGSNYQVRRDELVDLSRQMAAMGLAAFL